MPARGPVSGRAARPARDARCGLTLLELLVVVAILAVVAGGVVTSTGTVEAQTQDAVAKTEMLELQQAILAFRRDTGHLPGRGPFAPEGVGAGVFSLGTAYVGMLDELSASERSDMLDSPVCMLQLVEEPRRADGVTPVMAWDQDTRRGWNGPYLTHSQEGFVDVGAFTGDALTWDPTSTPLVAFVPAVADPFVAPPAGASLVWRQDSVADAPLTRFGRPYAFFVDDLDGDGDVEDDARIVSFGPNGRYVDPIGDEDNIVVYVLR